MNPRDPRIQRLYGNAQMRFASPAYTSPRLRLGSPPDASTPTTQINNAIIDEKSLKVISPEDRHLHVAFYQSFKNFPLENFNENTRQNAVGALKFIFFNHKKAMEALVMENQIFLKCLNEQDELLKNVPKEDARKNEIDSYNKKIDELNAELQKIKTQNCEDKNGCLQRYDEAMEDNFQLKRKIQKIQSENKKEIEALRKSNREEAEQHAEKLKELKNELKEERSKTSSCMNEISETIKRFTDVRAENRQHRDSSAARKRSKTRSNEGVERRHRDSENSKKRRY
uniref:Uncharacterized protein n=1 Tax=Panagrolaimus superbus TaxID=310955 RepID=A0A914Y0L3_9BILA